MCSEIVLKASMDNLDKALGFVEEQLEVVECPMKIAMKIVVCVEELFVNVANYAYEDVIGDCTICVENDDQQPDRVKITMTDSGKIFNPLEKEDPDTTLGVEEREIGGLGIFMVKNIMDSIYYARKEENNIIIMEKSW